MGFASATAGCTVPGLAGGEEGGDIGPRTAPPPATPVGQESASIPSVWAETGDSSFLGGRHETGGLTGDLNLTQASHRVDLS